MLTLSGLPYIRLRFNKDGHLADGAPSTYAPSAAVTDLIVISHGWHQDPDDAEVMYEKMLGHFQAEGGATAAGRKYGVIGIFWPSDQFRDDLSQEVVAVLGDQPGAASAAAGQPVDLDKLKARAKAIADLLGVDPDVLSRQAVRAADLKSQGDANKMVALLREAVGTSGDQDLATEHGAILDPDTDGWALVQQLQRSGAAQGGAAADGGAQAIDTEQATGSALGILGGIAAAVATVLNQFAYFELKKRAGLVGRSLGGLLDSGDLGRVERLHFVGHSFGARLVTAAASVMTARAPYSLTLIQAAFSHNAFGQKIKGNVNGAFRNVVDNDRVRQRIVVSHTWNDHAVGLLYAIASRASGDIAKGVFRVTPTFGGQDDIHGAMGANGPQKLQTVTASARDYDGVSDLALGAGIHSLKCDFIKGHNDIRTAQVGRLLKAAFA